MTAFVEPSRRIEGSALMMWRDVLNLKTVSIDDISPNWAVESLVAARLLQKIAGLFRSESTDIYSRPPTSRGIG